MKKRTMRRTKLFAFVLAVVMCVTVLPALSGKAEAETTITARPNYNGVFKVYNTYINYYPFTLTGNHNPYSFNTPYLYMEFSSNGGRTWFRSKRMTYQVGPLATDQGFKLDGLKPNTTYKTRIRYGDIYGNCGPALNTTTIKTGKAKAPKIKSVKIKAVNIKYHKHRVGPQAYWTGYHWVYTGSWTERYYSYKLRVTVKLKKKPKAKGLYVSLGGYGTKYVKGDKKKYTVTFTPLYGGYRTSRPPKGLGKKTVTIGSYQDKSKKWIGLSKTTKRKRKVR